MICGGRSSFMIWTKYNHIFESQKFGILLYNSLTNTFLGIGDDIYDQITRIRSDPQDFDYNENLKLKDVLVKIGVIYDGVDDDIRNQLKLQSSLNKYNKDFPNLTIIPTLDCNFRCIYCYEKDHIKPIYMDDETENRIVEFIDENHKQVKLLRIEWFGGEPLLAFERIVSLTERIRKLNIDFESGMVTNGYLFNMDKIRLLGELNISKIQITIDGTEETHNKRRPHFESKETYATILSNIEDILNYSKSNNHDFEIDIRINIDNENKNEYSSAYEELKQKFPEVNIYPGIVRGVATISKCNSLPCALSRKDIAEFYLEQSQDSENINLDYYPTWFGIANCTATRLYDYVIGPQGEIYSCWHDVGDNRMLMGNIHEKDVITNYTLLSRFIEGIDPFEDEKCKNCFYLPICGGGCPYYRVLNKYYNQNIENCIMHKGKETLERMLEIHYEMKLKLQAQKIERIIV